MMRVMAVSDLHGYLPLVPDCELLLLGGDYEPTRNIEQAKRFFQGPFTDWLKKVPARYIVGIAGNHDFALLDKDFAKSLPWIYLMDEAVELEGIKIYGSPWTRTFYEWAFMDSEDGLGLKFQNIPTGLDILLTHGPAFQHLDRNIARQNCGSTALLYHVERAKPDSHVFGHIHEARGIMQDAHTRYHNVTYLNHKYEPQYNCVDIQLRVGDGSENKGV